MLTHLDSVERQLATLDAQLERIAASERWGSQVQVLVTFRGISTLTALGLIAEIGDFTRFSHPRELASWLGITPSEGTGPWGIAISQQAVPPSCRT